MLSLRHVSRDQPIEGTTGLILTYADTGLHGRARSGAAGVADALTRIFGEASPDALSA